MKLVLPGLGVRHRIRAVLRRPVLAHRHVRAAVERDDRALGGPELRNGRENRTGRRHVAERQVIAEAGGADAGLRKSAGDQRARLGCERDAAGIEREIQRLFTEAIPRKEHAPRREVHDPERKHSSQPVDEPLAPLLVAVEQHFAVGMIGHEAMAVTGELAPKLPMVVDFAVEDEPAAAVLVRHRLGSGAREVDDREAPVSQEPIRSYRLTLTDPRQIAVLARRLLRLTDEAKRRARTIRTAMRKRVRGACAHLKIDWNAGRQHAENAAHRVQEAAGA